MFGKLPKHKGEDAKKIFQWKPEEEFAFTEISSIYFENGTHRQHKEVFAVGVKGEPGQRPPKEKKVKVMDKQASDAKQVTDAAQVLSAAAQNGPTRVRKYKDRKSMDPKVLEMVRKKDAENKRKRRAIQSAGDPAFVASMRAKEAERKRQDRAKQRENPELVERLRKRDAERKRKHRAKLKEDSTLLQELRKREADRKRARQANSAGQTSGADAVLREVSAQLMVPIQAQAVAVAPRPPVIGLAQVVPGTPIQPQTVNAVPLQAVLQSMPTASRPSTATTSSG